jgi:two-component system, LytTR family, sensor histidine kinase AlgZ
MPIQLQLPRLQVPFLCRGQFLVRVLVLSQAVAVVLAFSPGMQGDIGARLGLISVFVHWISMLTTLCLCAARNSINRLSPLGLIASVLSLFLAITLAVSASVFVAFHSLLIDVGYQMISFVLGNLMVAFIIAVVAVQFFILHAEKNEQVSAQSHAELTALQARIQPHFLFNTLNTVAELTQIDADAAERSLLALSALFRAALNAGQLVPLDTEVELAKQYLSLEQWRLGERMTVDWQPPEHLPQLLVPALTIQPLLENAIRYGIECSSDNNTLSVCGIVSSTALSLVITNPYHSQLNPGSGNGMALDNIRQRLRLQYGSAASLTYGVVDGLYRVKLVIPKP